MLHNKVTKANINPRKRASSKSRFVGARDKGEQLELERQVQWFWVVTDKCIQEILWGGYFGCWILRKYSNLPSCVCLFVGGTLWKINYTITV